MTSPSPDRFDARSLPDEYARLRAPVGRRVLELVARRWGDRQEGERRQLAQVLVTILEPLNQPDAQITEDLRTACEQAVATWIQRTVPVRELMDSTGSTTGATDPNRRLIRLVSAHLGNEEGGQWWAQITLERAGGLRHPARVRCQPDTVGDKIRAGAEATIESLQQALGGDLRIELREAGTFQAFDVTGVIVALAVTQNRRQWTAVGVCPNMANDPVRSGAVAVLNATNRRLGIG
jgi:hypothetical protein